MPRLFTGIEIPEEVRERLASLKAPLPGARWIDPENLHITLRFAGDVDNIVAREFVDGLAAIDEAAFEVRIAGLGAFGGNSPRILWAGVEGGPALEALARANERAARNAGLAPEKRDFYAHVTLARMQHARPDAVARFLERGGAFRTEPFLVDRFALFSARPQTGGGPYVVEEEFLLSGFGFDALRETDARR
jgi:RNA 2',3'-cyclic 3'-phosphodiesterase